MILVRRPLENGDYLLIGVFAAVSPSRLLSVIDEHCDPSGLEYAVVDQGGILLDMFKDSVFSEQNPPQKQEHEFFEEEEEEINLDLRVHKHGVGEQIYELIDPDFKAKWFSLQRALKLGVGEDECHCGHMHIMDSAMYVEPVGTEYED